MLFSEKKYQKPNLEDLLTGAHYNEAYFNGETSNWNMPYTWENFSQIFLGWAKFIYEGFPESKSFLDVGCARGFLVRALIEVASYNKFNVEAYGFDISEYAIETADASVKEFLQVCSITDYEFDRSYDVVLCLDVFEHCPEEDVKAFLKKAHDHCNHGIIASIPLETHEDDDPSHINIKPREWWHKTFLEAGFSHSGGWDEFQEMGNNDPFIKAAKVNLFVYHP